MHSSEVVGVGLSPEPKCGIDQQRALPSVPHLDEDKYGYAIVLEDSTNYQLPTTGPNEGVSVIFINCSLTLQMGIICPIS